MAVNEKALVLAAKYNKELKGEWLVIASEVAPRHRFISGSLSLDIALGGGWLGNSWAEVVGLENHGKTAIIFKTVAALQKQDPDFTTLWVAGEPYDASWAATLGVNNTQVIMAPTMDLEVAYDAVLSHVAERAVNLVVIDSYPALIAPDEGVKTVGDDATIAEGARLTGKFFRKMGAAGLRNPKDSGDSPWFGLFVNQWRDVIGWQPTGSPGITPGGKAKNYAFNQRVEVKRTEFIEDDGIEVGQTIKVKAFKNKGGPPRREAVVDFFYDDAPILGMNKGDYDVTKESVIVGVYWGAIQTSGKWHRYAGNQWDGIKNTIMGFREQPDLIAQLREDVFRLINNPEDRPVVEAKPPKVGRRK